MIYTDGVRLVANTLEELHAFALRLGLRREWFQDHRHPHYDLLGAKPDEAIALGAIRVTSRDIIRLQRDLCP
jgi:hypothetical protein